MRLDTESRARGRAGEVDVTGWLLAGLRVADLIPPVQFMNLAVKSGGRLAPYSKLHQASLLASARSGSQAIILSSRPQISVASAPPPINTTMALRTLARSALRFTPSAPAVRPTPLATPSRTLRLFQERVSGSSRRSFSSSSPVLRAPAPNATGTHAHSPLVPKNGQGINRPAKNNHQFWYREVFPCKCLALGAPGRLMCRRSSA